MTDRSKIAEPTPGPWTVDVNEKSGTIYIMGKRLSGDVNSHGDGWVAEIDAAMTSDDSRFPPRYPEDEANAYLIAAAPDLLSALPRIMTCLELVLSSKPCRDVPEAIGEARAALAKARGL